MEIGKRRNRGGNLCTLVHVIWEHIAPSENKAGHECKVWGIFWMKFLYILKF